MDGMVHTYKAHLVVKGYTQTFMVDYKETFSPVADIRAIRILISIAAFYDYEIWQMDAKIAFLNGYLDEDIYMVQPEGFVDHKYSNKVCKLQRSIYKMDNSKRGHILMKERLDLNKTQGASTPKEMKRMQNVPYVLDVGSIMYAVRCTRPDVAFAQNITSRFQQNHEAKLEFIATATLDLRLTETIKSLTGYVFVLNGETIAFGFDGSWWLKETRILARQHVVVLAAMVDFQYRFHTRTPEPSYERVLPFIGVHSFIPLIVSVVLIEAQDQVGILERVRSGLGQPFAGVSMENAMAIADGYM
uniref:Putative retrotransposon Ty1-copia subclass protein n=1 Tax=Tanacetum cinerariifolium TaxID=118510 RepID=A0A6L2LTB8_TANCI|nr:putative retrotransposon Ty1-copia subclass protein [Tanacetum cinerariifolium]